MPIHSHTQRTVVGVVSLLGILAGCTKPTSPPAASESAATVPASPDTAPPAEWAGKELPVRMIPDIPRSAEAYYAPDNLHVIAQTKDPAGVSLIQGLGAVNKTSIEAKGRTSKDSDTGMIMTESIQFIVDQYDGEALIDMGVRDQLLAGWGNIKVGLNSDPRREKVGLFYRDWKEVWWDPFGSPWLDPLVTKYVFSQKWTDLETVKAMFPEKDKDIDQAVSMR